MATPTTMIAGTRRTSSVAVAGGAMRKANTSRLPTVPNEATIASGQQHEQGGPRQPRVEAEQPRLALVERADEQRPVEHDDDHDGDRRGDDLAAEVGAVDAGDRSEQEAGEVAGVAAALARHDDDGEGEEADEQDADRGVVGQRRGGPHDVHAGDHRRRRRRTRRAWCRRRSRRRWRCPAARRGRGRRRGSSCRAARPTCRRATCRPPSAARPTGR